MLKFSANISLLFPELELADRFEAASQAGFKGVETLFAYDWPVKEQAAQLREFRLEQTLLNVAPGNWAAGERGLACLPSRKDAFRAGLDLAVDYANHLGCSHLHCVAGIAPDDVDHSVVEGCFIDNAMLAARVCASHDIKVLIEPINRINMPGFFCPTLHMRSNYWT